MNVCVVGEGPWDVGGECAGEDYDGDVPLVIAGIAREEIGRGRRFGWWPQTLDELPKVHPSAKKDWPRSPADGAAQQLSAALYLASQGTESGRFDALVLVRDSRWKGHEERERACRQVLDVEAPLIPHSALIRMPSENGGSACRRPP